MLATHATFGCQASFGHGPLQFCRSWWLTGLAVHKVKPLVDCGGVQDAGLGKNEPDFVIIFHTFLSSALSLKLKSLDLNPFPVTVLYFSLEAAVNMCPVADSYCYLSETRRSVSFPATNKRLALMLRSSRMLVQIYFSEAVGASFLSMCLIAWADGWFEGCWAFTSQPLQASSALFQTNTSWKTLLAIGCNWYHCVQLVRFLLYSLDHLSGFGVTLGRSLAPLLWAHEKGVLLRCVNIVFQEGCVCPSCSSYLFDALEELVLCIALLC